MKRADFIMMFFGCLFIKKDKIVIEDSPNKIFKGDAIRPGSEWNPKWDSYIIPRAKIPTLKSYRSILNKRIY